MSCETECRGGPYLEEFCTAFCRTMQHEGGFADDPDDPGGMTYMGIARSRHPAWQGWQVIDYLRAQSASPAYSLHGELQDMVRAFYYAEFWVRLHAEFVASLSGLVACELFDTAVNLGRRRAVEILQQALNLLNYNQQLWPDIIEDGIMGSATRGALTRCLQRRGSKLLVKVMNHLQAGHYIALMRRYPAREKYAGWFART